MNARQKKKQVTKKMKAHKPLSVQEQAWCRKYYSNGVSKLIAYYFYLITFVSVKKLCSAFTMLGRTCEKMYSFDTLMKAKRLIEREESKQE